MKKILGNIKKEVELHSDEAGFYPDDRVVISESSILEILDEAIQVLTGNLSERNFEHRISEVLPVLEKNQLYGAKSLIIDLANVIGINVLEVKNEKENN